MTKRKKILLIVLPIVVLLLILFTPIPKTEKTQEGTATSLNSITYKVVFWNLYENSSKPYKKTELILPPNNFSSAQSIFEKRENDLKNKGYGAISIIVTIEKIENELIWIREISNDTNTISSVVINFDDIEKYGKEITAEDIKEDILLKISFDGLLLKSYPATFCNIYSIKLINTKNTETIVNTPPTEDNNSSKTQINNSNQETTSNTTTSNNTQSSQIQNSVTETTSNVETNTTTSQEDDVFYMSFWDQKMRSYNDYYDDISKIYIPYRVIEPHNYDPNQKYPVILFLHGAGYRFNSIYDGNVNKRQLGTLESSFIFNCEWTTKSIIVAPHISVNDWWDFGPNSDGTLDAAMRIFEKVISEYSCDSNRFYVTGGSMGGYATWQVAVKHNDIFAAAMPMCGWWSTSDAPQLSDMPIRIIHGTADSTVSVESSIIMYDAIKQAGSQKVVLSLYDGAEHDVWRQAYFDAETWDWLFAQKKQ